MRSAHVLTRSAKNRTRSASGRGRALAAATGARSERTSYFESTVFRNPIGGTSVSKTASFVVVTALAVAAAVPASAQSPTPEHVRELMAQAQAQLDQAQTASQPSPGRAATGGARMDLTADEAVARALERNVTLASQRLTPRTFDYSLAALYGTYRPVVNSTVSGQSATTLGRQTIDGGEKTNQDQAVWNGGLQQNLRWGGGNYNVGWNNNRIVTTQNNAILNPSYASTFSATYTQPLLQGFKLDQNRTNILTTEISQDVAELDLQATT